MKNLSFVVLVIASTLSLAMAMPLKAQVVTDGFMAASAKAGTVVSLEKRDSNNLEWSQGTDMSACEAQTGHSIQLVALDCRDMRSCSLPGHNDWCCPVDRCCGSKGAECLNIGDKDCRGPRP